jgi:uncharacterized protein YlxW (UPF0749 family)
MTDTVEQPSTTAPAAGSGTPAARGGERAISLRVATAVACAVLGFLMVAQVRATEQVGDRLAAERSEDLARILSELTTQSDRLQSEITDLRLTLVEFETSAEREELALRTLQRRHDDLRILTGTTPVEGDGVVLTLTDPNRVLRQDQLVDTIQELRDAGAEAIAVNDVRLVASSAFTTRNERLLVDRQPIDPPYRIAAIGPPDTIAQALAIYGGAIESLQARPGVTAVTETRADLVIPAVTEARPFIFGSPVPPADTP